jgi:hypothetical protein
MSFGWAAVSAASAEACARCIRLYVALRAVRPHRARRVTAQTGPPTVAAPRSPCACPYRRPGTSTATAMPILNTRNCRHRAPHISRRLPKPQVTP